MTEKKEIKLSKEKIKKEILDGIKRYISQQGK